MITTILLAIVAFLAAGFVAKRLASRKPKGHRWDPAPEISAREYVSVAFMGSLLIGLVVWAGYAITIASKTNYEEFINGWETSAVESLTKCYRDGPCRNCYDCDPYIVSYSCNCSTDSKGNSHCQTCFRTEYHSCPYTTFERTFTVNTTVGSYVFATGVLPEKPQANLYRSLKSVPYDVIARAGTAPPSDWVVAKYRQEAGQPAPATRKSTYKNYILASDRTMMKTFSSDIAAYKTQGLMPDIPRAVNRYTSTRVVYAGLRPADNDRWVRAVEYLNGALGSELRGTLFLVFVDATKVQNTDRYALALKAHWQSTEAFGADALPKNAIVVILSATQTGKTVVDARAFTGMPIGNEALTVAVRSRLPGYPFNYIKLVGDGESAAGNPVKYHRSQPEPIIGAILWGRDGNPTTKFKRVSMSGNNGGPGFLYLKGEIEPSGWQSVLIFIFAMIISCVLWRFAYDSDLDFITPILTKLGITKKER